MTTEAVKAALSRQEIEIERYGRSVTDDGAMAVLDTTGGTR